MVLKGLSKNFIVLVFSVYIQSVILLVFRISYWTH